MTVTGPRAPTSAELLRAAVEAAVMAPSTHNSQPWRFRLVGTRLELHADPQRQLMVIDATRRQQIVSCGCALYNARVAIRTAGYADDVEIVVAEPDHPPGLLAIIGIGRPQVASLVDRELREAIPRRRTNRRAYLPRPVPEALTTPLIDAAADLGAAMVRLVPAQKHAIGELVDQADRLQYGDPAFREEIARWLTSTGSLRRDGIPFVEKEYGSALPFTVLRALRSPDLGGEFGKLEEEMVAGAPVVMVMGTRRDQPRDWLRCGEALQAVLLRATTHGLSAAFLNQALEIPALRERVAQAVDGVGHPQMIFRLGTPEDEVRHVAPRRPVDDVLEVVW